jgi:putative aldouronate transport system permease protein
MSDFIISKKRFTIIERLKRDWQLWIFVIPGLVLTFIFSYVPIYGIQIAFRRFSARAGIWGSRWVGLDHFERFFNSPNFIATFSNTVILSVYSLAASFPIPIILALMLNSFRIKKFGKVIQNVTYAPHFISVVVMCGMITLFLSPSTGVINTILGYLGIGPINFMAERGMWRSIYVWTGVWQNCGWDSVIYFAALSAVSPDLHEAAIVDGATKFQRIIHIDLPSIMPVASILLILNAGNLFSIGFEKAFLLQNDLNLSMSEIIPTYVYKVGLLQNDMSYSTAINLFNSVINSVLLLSVNKITGKMSGNSLW